MVKGIRGYYSRSDNQAAGDGTLRAVGGAVDNGNCVLTLFTGGISGGPAAVEVDRHNAALLQHDLRKLMHGAAAGKRLLTAVYHGHNYLAVRRYADHRARMAIRVVGAAGAGRHIGSVLDQNHGTADGLLHGAVRLNRSVPVGIVAATERSSVRKDCKPRPIVGLSRSHDTIHDEGASGPASTHVVKVAVDAGYSRVVFADETLVA